MLLDRLRTNQQRQCRLDIMLVAVLSANQWYSDSRMPGRCGTGAKRVCIESGIQRRSVSCSPWLSRSPRYDEIDEGARVNFNGFAFFELCRLHTRRPSPRGQPASGSIAAIHEPSRTFRSCDNEIAICSVAGRDAIPIEADFAGSRPATRLHRNPRTVIEAHRCHRPWGMHHCKSVRSGIHWLRRETAAYRREHHEQRQHLHLRCL